MGADPDGEAAWQSAVDDQFSREADEWQTAYDGRPDVRRDAHRRRLRLAVDMLQRVCPAGARILDLGCGPGVASVALAEAGHQVTAGDHSPAMLDAAAERARRAGVADRVTTLLLDAHDLPFPAASFDAVLALGVLQWSHSPRRVLAEMARVAKPGGHVVVNATNAAQLAAVIDPSRGALRAFGPIRRLARIVRPRAQHNLHSRAQLLGLLGAVGFAPIRVAAVGFGPFTLLGRRVLPDQLERWAQGRLEHRARRVPAIRGAGAQLVVLAVRIS